jgi:hypothetical protein
MEIKLKVAVISERMTDGQIAEAVIKVVGRMRAGRIAADRNFYIDRDGVTINLSVDGENGTATCTCGWSSGPYPWADYLNELVQAHSAGHKAAGQPVVDKTND